jgi:hypothetical protein
MLIEVVTEAHGPRLHRPDHREIRQGHRVVTAIDIVRSPPVSVPPGTYFREADPGRERFSAAPRHLYSGSVGVGWLSATRWVSRKARSTGFVVSARAVA